MSAPVDAVISAIEFAAVSYALLNSPALVVIEFVASSYALLSSPTLLDAPFKLVTYSSVASEAEEISFNLLAESLKFLIPLPKLSINSGSILDSASMLSNCSTIVSSDDDSGNE